LRRISKTAAIYPGTQLGADVEIGDYAVVGKQPTLGPQSTAPREDLPPLVIGDGTSILAGAVIFAGTRLGAGVIVGDQACVRERCDLADHVVVGRGVTAYSTLEEDVFLAPCVVTTNDNFMGRTERRHELRKGPTIRRGARIGGGAILLPGIEIGEEAFVGAGAVVLDDVPARAVVVGNPARKIRDVADEELLA
jgi:acetyltransferase-like isoleucine patch superfamily enzyme